MDSPLDCGCVARINSTRKAGTGVLVSPSHLLTCAHVVSRFNPLKPHEGGLKDIESEVRVFFPALDGLSKEERRGTVIRTSEQDLAVIRLEANCHRSQAGFYRPAKSWMLQSPEYAERSVVGFDSAESRTFRMMTFADTVAYKSDVDDSLVEFQTAGGISNGMSGSPLLARAFGSTICLGVVYLGGAASGTSRFIAPSTILEFLDELELDAEFKGPWNSSEEIAAPAHLGALIRTQRVKRLVTRAELAQRLGIGEAVVENWERGVEPLPGAAESSVRGFLVDGDPAALNSWLRLSGRSDLLLELQPLTNRNASCALVAAELENRLVRGFAPDIPRPTRLRVGTRVNFQIHLPAPCHLIFVTVERLETFPRFYSLIGSGLLSPELRGPGGHSLPDHRKLRVEGAAGHNCLVMLGSSESSPDPWAACRDFDTEPLEGASLDRLTAVFRSITPKDRVVAIAHYEVY